MRWLLFSLNGIRRTQTSRNFYSTLITQFTGLKSQLLVLAVFLRFANPRCNCTIFVFHFPLLDEIGKFPRFEAAHFANGGRLSAMRKFKTQRAQKTRPFTTNLCQRLKMLSARQEVGEGNVERGARREESCERVYQQVGATRKYRTMFGQPAIREHAVASTALEIFHHAAGNESEKCSPFGRVDCREPILYFDTHGRARRAWHSQVEIDSDNCKCMNATADSLERFINHFYRPTT